MTTATQPGELALLGGAPAIAREFRRYNSIGPEEAAAAQRVLTSGVLSRFLGSWGPDFYGGPEVQAFERAWEQRFGVRHAVTVNSLTSGLIASLGAVGLEPGDEVIVSPWTMCASATAALHWNAIPVFADIEPDFFCLDPASVEAQITPHTRAIVAVDIFGQSADTVALGDLAKRHGLHLISDTAQAPGASISRGHGWAGTDATIGGFSLNYHKHIHTGEGGVMVTDDDELAERMRLIRNHAEAVVGPKGTTNLSNMLGHNFRLGEIEAAIGREQLVKLDRLVAGRRAIAERLTAGLASLPGVTTPRVRQGGSHVYYLYCLTLDVETLRVSRDRLVDALTAEGVPHLAKGYANVHLLPMFQQKIAYGSHGFPWSAPFCRRDVDYRRGICPVAERLHSASALLFEVCQAELSETDVDLIIAAFHKVWRHMDRLR